MDGTEVVHEGFSSGASNKENLVGDAACVGNGHELDKGRNL